MGGADPSTDRTEPVHVLFVVPESPASKVQTVYNRHGRFLPFKKKSLQNYIKKKGFNGKQAEVQP